MFNDPVPEQRIYLEGSQVRLNQETDLHFR